MLGTGGGGSPYLTLLNMRALYKEGRRVQLMPASDLDDDDWVGVVASMGAPLVGQERLTDSHTITRAARLMEKHSGRKFDAVMSVEIGGGNGVRPLMVAAHLGVPVVDSDTMGRAYPEAQMSSVAVGELKPYPLDGGRRARCRIDRRESAELEMGREGRAQDLRRVRRDGVDLQAAHRRRSEEVGHPRHHEQGDRDRARRARGPAHACRSGRGDPRRRVRQALYRGKVVDVERRVTEGYLRGLARFDGMDDYRGSRLALDFQNEWIVARLDGQPIATSPDLICVLDTESGEAVGSETIRYGQRITVIALPSPPVFLTPKGLQHVGPRAFGYDLEFKSVLHECARDHCRRDRIARGRRLGAGHRRRRQSLSGAAQHACALQGRLSRAS